jgi:3-methyladenine DNA glycosylase Mpg
LELKINNKDVNGSFKRIASELMNDWILISNDNKYRIAEIEFYFNHKGLHEDSYTHGHELQKQSGKWYLHGSGIDITFGNEDCYGGILIRALQDLQDEKNYIYGPINSLTEIFKNFGDVYKHQITVGLERDSEGLIKKEKPIAAPRVGLNKAKDALMHEKFYRFLVLPKKKHADKTLIEKAMKKQDFSDAEIKSIWG